MSQSLSLAQEIATHQNVAFDENRVRLQSSFSRHCVPEPSLVEDGASWHRQAAMPWRSSPHKIPQAR
jgi:hypothetical protein